MPKVAIILLILALLILVMYLAEIRIKLRFTRRKKEKRADNPVSRLSRAELSVFEKMAAGKTNQEIADELFLSVHTVKKHTGNIFKKLGIKSRNEIRKFSEP